jgi:hypothetical protein
VLIEFVAAVERAIGDERDAALPARVRRVMATLVDVAPRALRSRSERARLASLRLATRLVATLADISLADERARLAREAAAAATAADSMSSYTSHIDDSLKLLPSVHAMWSALAARLADSSSAVQQAALATLAEMARRSGTFIGARFATDAWPTLRATLARVPASCTGGGVWFRVTLATLDALLAVVCHCEPNAAIVAEIDVAVSRVSNDVRWLSDVDRTDIELRIKQLGHNKTNTHS